MKPDTLGRLHGAVNLPPSLAEAARFVLEHRFDAATRSMRALARVAGIPPATLTRLAHALGYQGWNDLRDELIEAERAPASPFSSRGRKLAADGLASRQMEAVAGAMRELDVAGIAGTGRLLASAPRVFVAGFRSCAGPAIVLHYQLRLFRPEVHLLGAAGLAELDLAGLHTPDCVVLFSFDPYSRAALDVATAARHAGAHLVAATDAAGAPHVAGAQAVHMFGTESASFFPSLAAATALAELLAGAAFTAGGAAALARLTESETALGASYVGGSAR